MNFKSHNILIFHILFTFDISFGSIGSRFTGAIWIGMIGFVFIMTVDFFRISNCFFCFGMPVLQKIKQEKRIRKLCVSKAVQYKINFDDFLTTKFWQLLNTRLRPKNGCLKTTQWWLIPIKISFEINDKTTTVAKIKGLWGCMPGLVKPKKNWTIHQ